MRSILVDYKDKARFTMTVYAHDAFINLAKSLGYIDVKQGFCSGISLAWIAACITHEEDVFIRHMERIKSEVGIAENISLLRKKMECHGSKPLTKDELDLFEVLCFCEMVALSQSPGKYSEIFNTFPNQEDIERIMPLTSSKKLEALSAGGLTTVYSEPRFSSQEEIAAYLDDISDAIESVGYQNGAIIGFSLGSWNHAIGLSYDTGKHCWKVMDINMWPPLTFHRDDTTRVAREISDSFSETGDLYTAFNTQIVTTKNDPHKNDLMNALKILPKQPITKAMAERNEVNKLIFLATAYGYDDVLRCLANEGVNLDVFDSQKATPAFIAAKNGHDAVIKVLAQSGARLEVSEDGQTPTGVAIFRGHTRVIAALGKSGVNFELPAFSNSNGSPGLKPVDVAVIFGNIKSLAILAAYGAKPSQWNYNLHSLRRDATGMTWGVQHEKELNAVIAFHRALWAISQKQKQFVTSGHKDAAQVAHTLHQILVAATLQYFSGDTNQKNYKRFSATCKQALKDARPVLECHRGWKDILGKIALAIISLGLINAALAIKSKCQTGHFSFRLFKTHSATQMDNLEESMNNSAPQIGA